MQKSFQHYTNILFLVFTTFFWGATFVFVKATVQIIPIDGFLVVRFAVATIIMTTFILWDKSIIKAFKSKKIWIYGTILGTLLYASFWFQTMGLKYTTPSKAAFITGLNVILVPVIQRLPPFRDHVKKSAYTIAALALIGLALMTIDFSNLYLNWADAIILLTAIAVAYHIVIVGKTQKLNIYALLIIQLFIVFSEALIIAIIRGNMWNPLTKTTPIVWITIAFTAILATGFAFWAQINAQQNNVNANNIALIFALEPVFALIIDVIRKIYPTIIVLTGMTIILIATVLAIYNENEENVIEVVP